MTEKPQHDSAFNQIRRADEQQFNIQIAADGRWFHEGGEIRRKALVKLFASVLKRDLAGVFWLETPVEKGRIEVADAPFIATRLILQHAGTASTTADPAFGFVTNVDNRVPLDAAHPIQMLPSPNGSGKRPYIEVRDGLLAKLSRPVYYELASHAVAGQDGRMGVWSHNQFFVLE
jgi:hypothetical protein